MIVIAALACSALGAGLLVTAVASRWPTLDPSAPKVHPGSPSGRDLIEAHPGLRGALRRRMDPSAATGLALSGAVSVMVGGVVGAGLLLIMAQHDAGLARFDLAFSQWGTDHASSGSTAILKQVSALGGTAGVLLAASLGGVIELARSRRPAVVALLAITVGGQFLATHLIKAAVERPRPDLNQLTGFAGTSFPSGHAAAAAATYAVIALLLGRGRSRRVQTALASVAAGIAVAVAATRVLLGVHWFTDALAGLGVGWAWFAFCSVAFGGRRLRFGEPVAEAERVAMGASNAADGSPGRALVIGTDK